MSKKTNYFIIGLFILIGFFLFLGAIVTLGSGYFSGESTDFISYFDGSVKGLKKGAAVNFNGVKVGEVKTVNVKVDGTREHIVAPVTYTIFTNHIEAMTNDSSSQKRMIKKMVENGLVAELELESFVTGLLAINLNFNSKKGNFSEYKSECTQIPSVTASGGIIEEAFNGIPILELVKDIRSTSTELKTFLVKANSTLGEADGTFSSVNGLIKKAENTFSKIDSLVGNTENSVLKADGLISSSEKTFSELNTLLSSDSTLLYDIKLLLNSSEEAAREIKNLSSYLSKHPEAIIRGK